MLHNESDNDSFKINVLNIIQEGPNQKEVKTDQGTSTQSQDSNDEDKTNNIQVEAKINQERVDIISGQ